MTTQMQEALRRRAQLTRPDYVTYIPSSWDETAYDRVNEHFLTFDGPDGSLMAIWTQEFIRPGQGNINHTIFSRSEDEGVTWAPPRVIAGPKTVDDPAHMTSWAFPLVSKSGRIYVVYNRHVGIVGWIRFHTGGMAGIYSDDCGATWSEPQEIAMPTSPYNDPAGVIPPEWIVWQKPMRDLSGGYFVGYSHWVNRAVATLKEVKDWTEIESVVEFMRFVNVDADPQPRDLDIRYSPPERALRVPHRMHPLLSIAQEPSLVRLPDDRLFCVMRTCSGYMWWSQSSDDGETWCSPRPLLHRDFGLPMLNPVASDPIYALSQPGRYVLFYHNNIGGPAAGGTMDAMPREPVYISLGEFRPEADQPVWFSQPKLFMATEGVAPDGVTRSLGDTKAGSLSMYSSFTNRNGVDVLWYPDSKFFLLGKRITAETLAGLAAPGDLEHEGAK